MSLRARILAGIVAPAVVLLVALSAVVWVRVRADRIADLDAALRARAAALAAVVERDDDGRFETEPLAPLVTGLLAWHVRAHPAGPLIDGEPLEAATDALGAGAPPLPWPDMRPAMVLEEVDAVPGGRRLRAVFLVRAEEPQPRAAPDAAARGGTSEAPLVQIDVVASLVPIDAALRSLAATLLVVGALLSALAALMGAALSRRIAGPLAAMADAAERVRTPSATAPLARSGRGDEVDRLAATLNDAFLRTFAAWDEQRRFAADASHELRTPLASLRAQAEVMLRAPRSAAEYREALGTIVEAAQRMQRIVEGLLLLARADRGALEAEWVELDLAELVADAVRVAQAGLVARGEAGVSIVATPPALAGRGCVVRGSAHQLALVVSNLIDNAARHARMRVTASVAGDDDGVTITVDDDGPGIPPPLRTRVFERFFRVDAARSADQGGSGLGLSIVRTLVQLHGGAVRAEESPARGARLVVRLPPSHAADERSAGSSSSLQGASLS